MCMLSVIKCTVLEETKAFKCFQVSPNGHLYNVYQKLGNRVRRGEWLQAAPVMQRVAPVVQPAFDNNLGVGFHYYFTHYFTGFHTFRTQREATMFALAEKRYQGGIHVFPVLIRGIAYYGKQALTPIAPSLASPGWGWTAQEMFVF